VVALLLLRHRLLLPLQRREARAGLSYRPGIPAETMTPEQFIADTLSAAGSGTEG